MPVGQPDPDATAAHARAPADPTDGSSFPLPLDTAPTASPVETPPPAIPGYTLDGVLGRGGMGVVYRATQTALRRPAAVKVLLGGGHASGAAVARLRAEAATVAALDHPNVVRVYDAGDAGGLPYLAMELCPGGSLSDRLKAGPLAVAEAVGLVAAVARGVGAAHAAGVIHRDLKPGNVLFAADGTPKVADFGLAKQTDGDGGLTATFAVMGTPAYMAPEQAEGKAKRVGPRADVWAVGVILYECLTGCQPFVGESMLDTLDLVRFGKLVSPRRLRPDVPPAVEAVCLRCLQRKPEDRFATAAEVGEALTEATTRPDPPVPRRRLVIALPVVIAAVGLGVAISQRPAGVVLRSAADSPPTATDPTPAPRLALTEGIGYALLVAGADNPDVAPATALDLSHWEQALAGLVPPANRRVVRWSPGHPLPAGRKLAPLVREAMADLFARPTPADTLFVLFTGQGFAPAHAPDRLVYANRTAAGDLDPEQCLAGDELAAALATCQARVKLVVWDADRYALAAGWVPRPEPEPWGRVANCAVHVACSAGQPSLCDWHVGSFYSRAAAAALGAWAGDGPLTAAGFERLAGQTYDRELAAGLRRPGNEAVKAVFENQRPRPQVFGTLPPDTPLLRVNN